MIEETALTTSASNTVVFNLLTLTPGQNDAGWGLLETKRVATGCTGRAKVAGDKATR
jgi:hypothetical protein